MCVCVCVCMCVNKIWALNNPQRLTYYKTQPTSNSNFFSIVYTRNLEGKVLIHILPLADG